MDHPGALEKGNSLSLSEGGAGLDRAHLFTSQHRSHGAGSQLAGGLYGEWFPRNPGTKDQLRQEEVVNCTYLFKLKEEQSFPDTS